MHREGHLGVGLLLYSPIAFLLVDFGLSEVFVLGMVGMGFWSIAPDVDLSLPIPHRGPTHTFLAAGVAGVLTAVVSLYLASTGGGGGGELVIRSPILAHVTAAIFGFFIGFLGVISHLVGDVVTMAGIHPWRPFSERKHGMQLVLAKDKRVNQGLMTLGSVAMAVALVMSEML